jgi:hypothetical protein
LTAQFNGGDNMLLIQSQQGFFEGIKPLMRFRLLGSRLLGARGFWQIPAPRRLCGAEDGAGLLPGEGGAE